MQRHAATADSLAAEEALKVSLPAAGFSFPVLTPVPHIAAGPVIADLSSFHTAADQLPVSFRLAPLSHPVAVTPSTASTAARGSFLLTPDAASPLAAHVTAAPSATPLASSGELRSAVTPRIESGPAAGGGRPAARGTEPPAAVAVGHTKMLAEVRLLANLQCRHRLRSSSRRMLSEVRKHLDDQNPVQLMASTL